MHVEIITEDNLYIFHVEKINFIKSHVIEKESGGWKMSEPELRINDYFISFSNKGFTMEAYKQIQEAIKNHEDLVTIHALEVSLF